MYGDMLFDSDKKEEALSYYMSAADRGNWEARIKVASLCSCDTDDEQEIVNLFQKTLIPGNGFMEYRYGELLLKVAWNDRDREKAFNMFLQSAKDGFPEALHQVAVMYRDGIGTV